MNVVLLPAALAVIGSLSSCAAHTSEQPAPEGDADGWTDSAGMPGGGEMCNGLDDDGDGMVDESPTATGLLTEPCHSICGSGERMCIGATWSDCSAPDPGPDGSCPCAEGEVRPCTSPCGTGFETCSGGAFSGCTAPEPEEEICEDGVDNDCDGEVDEECSDCVPGEKKRCGTDVGTCVSGTRTCRSDGTWGGCVGNVGPTEEICDGLDNDCDGEVDEDLSPDAGEYNDSCSMARRLPDVEEGGGVLSVLASVYPAGDEDWMWVRALEGWHDCEPLSGQCYYSFTVLLDAPPGADLEVCMWASWPGDAPDCATASDPHAAHCTEPGEEGFTLEWEGICMIEDSLDFVVVVRERPGSPPSCGTYDLRFMFDGPTDVCPWEYE